LTRSGLINTFLISQLSNVERLDRVKESLSNVLTELVQSGSDNGLVPNPHPIRSPYLFKLHKPQITTRNPIITATRRQALPPPHLENTAAAKKSLRCLGCLGFPRLLAQILPANQCEDTHFPRKHRVPLPLPANHKTV
jgi:hypothetical protein